MSIDIFNEVQELPSADLEALNNSKKVPLGKTIIFYRLSPCRCCGNRHNDNLYHLTLCLTSVRNIVFLPFLISRIRTLRVVAGAKNNASKHETKNRTATVA